VADELPENLNIEPTLFDPIVDEIPPSRAQGLGKWLLETALLVGGAFLLAMVVRVSIAEAMWIPTGSMETTIMTNDRVFTEKVSYYFSDPTPGDIVVFDDPRGGDIPLIKRVIATEGQTVDIRDGRVEIDGNPLPETYLHGLQTIIGSVTLPLTVPQGEIWVMGDNRPNSFDSRFFGTLPVSTVHGRAMAIYWPPEHIRSVSE